jgi:hypothetical protein
MERPVCGPAATEKQAETSEPARARNGLTEWSEARRPVQRRLVSYALIAQTSKGTLIGRVNVFFCTAKDATFAGAKGDSRGAKGDSHGKCRPNRFSAVYASTRTPTTDANATPR